MDYLPPRATAEAAAMAKAKSAAGPENPESATVAANERANVLNLFNITGNPLPPSEPQPAFPAQPDGPPMNPVSGTPYLEATLANHQRWVWDCAFSADSAYLVTVSSDHYARLWELASGQIIRQYSGHHRGAVCVALNDYSEPR